MEPSTRTTITSGMNVPWYRTVDSNTASYTSVWASQYKPITIYLVIYDTPLLKPDAKFPKHLPTTACHARIPRFVFKRYIPQIYSNRGRMGRAPRHGRGRGFKSRSPLAS